MSYINDRHESEDNIEEKKNIHKYLKQQQDRHMPTCNISTAFAKSRFASRSFEIDIF